MKKVLFGAATAVGLGAVAFTSGAQAQCVWDGFNWSCPPAPTEAYSYYNPYAVAVPWQTYPTTDTYYGYKPQWLPSSPGPRAASGAGR